MKINLEYIGDGRFRCASEVDRAVASTNCTAGQVLRFTLDRSRSMKEHRWWFAVLQNVYDTLPDEHLDRFPSVEHLRAYSLIRAGWCDMAQEVYSDDRQAVRTAHFLRRVAPMSVITYAEGVVSVYTARSMAVKACRGDDWRRVVDQSLAFWSSLLGCDASSLVDGIHDVPEWVTQSG